ncbi:sec23/Sec24 protein transport family protein [Pelomyxa schiedti]|nr:sec23/Sec24 protein transport family protein [Pelomyxa schiedti]
MYVFTTVQSQMSNANINNFSKCTCPTEGSVDVGGVNGGCVYADDAVPSDMAPAPPPPCDVELPSAPNTVVFGASQIPKYMDMAKSCGVPIGMLYTPGVSVKCCNVINHAPIPCASCGAFANTFSEPDQTSGQWNCVFCRYTNPVPRAMPDFHQTSSTVKYLQPLSGGASCSSSEGTMLFFFLIDANFPGPEMEELCGHILRALSVVQGSACIGFATFDNAISLYQLANNKLASADVVPGNVSPTLASIKPYTSKALQYVCPISSALRHLTTITKCLIHSTSQINKNRVPLASRPRCLGSAVEIALALLTSSQEMLSSGTTPTNFVLGSHVLVFTNSYPSWGPGSLADLVSRPKVPQKLRQGYLDYYNNVATIAMHRNAAITCFCQGFQVFGIPELQSLVTVNGGHLLLIRQFDSTFFTNMTLLMTYGLHQKGQFSIKCSDGIQVSRMIGPASVQDSPNRATQWNSGSVNGRTCYTIFIEIVGMLEEGEGNAYFQFVMQYTDVVKHFLVTEICTYRLPVTSNRNSFLRSVDVDTAALLLIKKTVFKARRNTENDFSPNKIDNTLRNITYACGEKRGALFLLPDHLSSLPLLLFMARRGPLLGQVLQHRDDIDSARIAFLQAPPESALRMIIPDLLLAKEDRFEQLPPEDLAMQSGNVLFFDHEFDICIWIGAEAAQHESLHRSCMSLALQRSATRFPVPSVLVVKEGVSDARWLWSRLIPSHKDTEQEQLWSFPGLRSLLPKERAVLVAKFPRTDDLSFSQYYRSLFA